MSDSQKISVALTGEQLACVKSAVESGDYATTSEVMREAIRDWQLKREHRKDESEQLRHLWDEGAGSGPRQLFDVELIIASAKARLKASGLA